MIARLITKKQTEFDILPIDALMYVRGAAFRAREHLNGVWKAR